MPSGRPIPSYLSHFNHRIGLRILHISSSTCATQSFTGKSRSNVDPGQIRRTWMFGLLGLLVLMVVLVRGIS